MDNGSPLRQTQHYSPQFIEVAGQPVPLVTNTVSPSRTKLCMAPVGDASHPCRRLCRQTFCLGPDLRAGGPRFDPGSLRAGSRPVGLACAFERAEVSE
jgi:hypothetical protein